MMIGKIKCPMCCGSGEIDQPQFKQKLLKEKSETAKRMREQGYSMREIACAIGYKSPASIMKLLRK